jgi:hypothetical protein
MAEHFRAIPVPIPPGMTNPRFALRLRFSWYIRQRPCVRPAAARKLQARALFVGLLAASEMTLFSLRHFLAGRHNTFP